MQMHFPLSTTNKDQGNFAFGNAFEKQGIKSRKPGLQQASQKTMSSDSNRSSKKKINSARYEGSSNVT